MLSDPTSLRECLLTGTARGKQIKLSERCERNLGLHFKAMERERASSGMGFPPPGESARLRFEGDPFEETRGVSAGAPASQQPQAYPRPPGIFTKSLPEPNLYQIAARTTNRHKSLPKSRGGRKPWVSRQQRATGQGPQKRARAAVRPATLVHGWAAARAGKISMKHRSPPRRSALSVCPCGDPRGTPLQLEIRETWAPVKPPRGQTLRSPRPKVHFCAYSKMACPNGTTTALCWPKPPAPAVAKRRY